SQPEPIIKKGKVNTSTLNVRSKASASGTKLGSLSKGTIVEIVKIESNGWYKIKYKNGYGYVSKEYITDEGSGGGGGSQPEPIIKKGKVNTSTLNVRSKASASGTKLGSLSKGTIVEIVKIESNGWYKIKYKNGYGYVSKEYITDEGSGGGGSQPEPIIKKGKVNTSTLNVRSKASASGTKLGSLSKGTIVEIVKIESNGWYKIKYKNGYGYVSKEYITDEGSDDGGSGDRVFQNPAGYIQLKDKITVSGAGKNLVSGTMGLRVAKVQRKLGMGYVWETIGPQTISKVKIFQQKNGLKATGVVDLTTWKKMGFSESEWYSIDAYVTPVKTTRKSTKKDIIEQMIRTAETYLGTEYVVGASGVPGSGIDCSGLVIQSMYSVGIDPAPVSVTRHTQPGYEYESRNLWNLPTLKTVSTPQRGDLVFYKSTSGTIIHVAIYLGNNQVIESWPEKVVKWPLIHPQRPLIKGYKRVIG
ncbi:MAG: SH3 domain-containing protein, partial [Terrisporobacter sp.]